MNSDAERASDLLLQALRYAGYINLKRLCPNLKAVMLDPVHLAILYEYGHWHKRTPGSKALRSILVQTCAVDDSMAGRLCKSFYDGDMPRPLDAYSDMIWSKSMPLQEATQVLETIDCDKPLRDRRESRFTHEVFRKAARAQQRNLQDFVGCMRTGPAGMAL